MNPIEDLTHRPPWMDDGICAQTDPEAFYPEKGGSTREAKRICMGCPVKELCLQYALENHERFGIWGGYSERERRYLERDANYLRRQDDPVLVGEVLELAETGMNQHQIAIEVRSSRWVVAQIIAYAKNGAAA